MDHVPGGAGASGVEQSVARPASARKAITVREFYEAIDGVIGLNTLYEFARSGRLKSVRIGRKLLILASEVDDFFEREANVN